jgi:RNA polymerase sigma-70 factor, ECF subfamily
MPHLEAKEPPPRRSPRHGPATAGDSALLSRAIAHAKEQDADALRFLYVRFADDVCRHVQTILRDRHAAEDVTQTIFSNLLAKMRHYQPREVPFKGWLLRVAHDAAVDHVRSRRMIPFAEPRARDAGAETRLERCRSLRLALERLSPEQREVLVLRHIAGLTPPEIAQRLNKSERAINGLHHRGRGALKATLRELDAAPGTRAG